MQALYREFSQGISVAICAAMSASTLGYMMLDSHKIEKKQLRNDYEKQILSLNDEIKRLTLGKKSYSN
jgi:hypothetical protein